MMRNLPTPALPSTSPRQLSMALDSKEVVLSSREIAKRGKR
jgi:hypothetical protein